MKSHIMAILGLMSVVLVGTASAETYKYTGDDLPEYIHVYRSDVIFFTGGEKVTNLKIVHPWVSSGCENIGSGGTCKLIFSGDRWAVGQYEWESDTGASGKIRVNPVPEIDDTAGTPDSVLAQAKNFKAQIEAKIAEKIAPLQAENVELQNQMSNRDEVIKTLNTKVIEMQAHLKTEQANSAELQSQLEVLEDFEASASPQIERYKLDAHKWRDVAVEQLRIMVEILKL